MIKFDPDKFDFQGIIYNNTLITCNDFKTTILSLAEYFKKNKKKNRSPFIYLVAENHPKTVIAYFAILQAEYSCVLIDPDWKALEWEYILSDTPPCAIIKITDQINFTDFQKDIEFLPENYKLSFEEKRGYTIVYTAAEDGYAKGALLSQHNIITDALSHATTNNAGSSDTVCALLPLSHLFGLTIGILAPIYSHSRILIENVKNLNALKTITDDFQTHKVTYFYTIPVLIFLLGNIPNVGNKFSTFKLVTTGGYKLPENVYTNFKKKFNIEIHEGYGLTEASPVCSWHHPDDKVKIDSVGRPFSCCKFKVTNTSGIELPVGSIGELCVQGEHVMEGYYSKPELNSKTIIDGWLHTGDQGYIGKDNYIYITGLIKNMKSVGGKNVYPEELKRMLLTNDNVADIDLLFSESELTGTKISAKIRLKADSVEQQKQFMKWSIENISAYKLPKSWDFVN
jgi:long-chain acyl-CoA synthetase